jgi:hypothetical protein
MAPAVRPRAPRYATGKLEASIIDAVGLLA